MFFDFSFFCFLSPKDDFCVDWFFWVAEKKSEENLRVRSHEKIDTPTLWVKKIEKAWVCKIACVFKRECVCGKEGQWEREMDFERVRESEVRSTKCLGCKDGAQMWGRCHHQQQRRRQTRVDSQLSQKCFYFFAVQFSKSVFPPFNCDKSRLKFVDVVVVDDDVVVVAVLVVVVVVHQMLWSLMRKNKNYYDTSYNLLTRFFYSKH